MLTFDELERKECFEATTGIRFAGPGAVREPGLAETLAAELRLFIIR